MVEDITASGGIPKRLPRNLVPYARGWLAFLEATEATLLEQETTVWNSTYGYSGTLDLSLSIPEETWEDQRPSWYEGPNVPIIADVKTTRSGVHAEVSLQLAAYANAEEKMVADKEGAFHPEPWPTHQATGLVVWLRPDQWSLVPVDIGPDVFRMFKVLRQVFDWEKGRKDEVLYPPIAGSILEEEDIIQLVDILRSLGGK